MPKRLTNKKTAQGFTLIEVMLVLGLAGLLLLGTLGGTFSAISSQRYNDSVRSFAEFLRTVYSEVISPESLKVVGTDIAVGREKRAILGKIIVFGADNSDPSDGNRKVFTATIEGNADLEVINRLNNPDLKTELGDSSSGGVGAQIRCDTVDYYLPTWGAELRKPEEKGKNNARFAGSVIIVRSPSSGTVQTRFQNKTYDLGACASTTSTKELDTSDLEIEPIGICVQSGNANLFREVRIAENGRNTSAISILSTDSDDEGENKCQ